jgi:DNA modification methylase
VKPSTSSAAKSRATSVPDVAVAGLSASAASVAALAGATGQPLVIRRVPLSSLHQDPANARSHPERNLASIRASLARFGQAEPLVVLKGAGRVIGGNGRLVAMQSLGWTECDIVELELSPVEAAALGIALNRTAELAEWDPKALAAVVESLRTENALEGIGFDAREIDKLIAQAASLDSLVDSIAPAPPDRATTRLGDLWILGSHRLLCGDSSDRASLERLLAGQRIQLVNTDPPYNVAVEPRSNNAIAAGFCSFPSGARAHLGDFDLARHPEKAKATTAQLRPKDRPLANDAVSVEEFDRLLRAWFGNLAFALEPGRAFYIWGGYGNLKNYPPAIADSELYFSQAIIWVKNHPVLGRKDFMSGHEWAYYGWREGAAHVYLGPNNAVDVWEVKKLNHTEMVHLTEKPIELALRAMHYSSREGENVLDLFGGSGSTLAAAEQAKRKAFLMELDPLYCDVIIKRWEELTGREATLESDGRTFAEIAREREEDEPDSDVAEPAEPHAIESSAAEGSAAE